MKRTSENKTNTRKHIAWTEEEITVLREFFPAHGAEYVAEKLSRTVSSVKYKAKELHVYKLHEGEPWSQAHDAYLQRYYPFKTPGEIATVLGRTPKSVTSRAQKLGVSCFEMLDYSIPYIAKAFGCSKHTVVGWIENDGLPCKKIVRGKITYRFIEGEKFWKWGMKHLDLLPLVQYEEYSVLPQPAKLHSIRIKLVFDKIDRMHTRSA